LGLGARDPGGFVFSSCDEIEISRFRDLRFKGLEISASANFEISSFRELPFKEKQIVKISIRGAEVGKSKV
jgi:hypothetical protein